MATILDDVGLSARITADVVRQADVSTAQTYYLERGRLHKVAADIVDNTLTGQN
ncbi:hypothetical protein ACWZHB_12890 [Nocardia sp. FBN12]|uniref:hypothetical protein n=1 Tax=Nocardia sp. FBN12 TaxID=3419766 RepID=UPI003D0218E6